jgi:hypothetical protein
MSADDLREHLRRRPFIPFVVVTTDGTRYKVPHPEFMMPLKRHVIIAKGDTDPDTSVYLSLLHVQRVEVQEPAET